MNEPVKPRSWKQNPEAVKADILAAARQEFAEHGLSRARVQDIAARTKTSKRMVFYYFKDKEALYQAVLEDAYAEVRQGELELKVDDLAPDVALQRLIQFTFDHHRANPDFIRLVMIENIHGGRHMQDMAEMPHMNKPAVLLLDRICKAGVAAGLFREDVHPLRIHWQISAASVFNVANRITFSYNFGTEFYTDTGQDALRAEVTRTIMLSVLKPGTPIPQTPCSDRA
ncbi:TetR family transcriptional regulator [Thioclava sp. SK-1]|uniref:TetR/AcrR family transcriptional regulator n=1 Tax=Thioclava sp. SK-1 TaxID=1889770 RepID=UPI000826C7D1|nr:TetR/AcrR family transcriptional regulator [Thioclava sp. SK-1]OCX67355.1 TetR family transcriptional regulator [Thioclava sp. SK-1]